MWMTQYPNMDFSHYHFDYCSKVHIKIHKGQEKCEKGYMNQNMENVLKGHIIQSNQINI